MQNIPIVTEKSIFFFNTYTLFHDSFFSYAKPSSTFWLSSPYRYPPIHAHIDSIQHWSHICLPIDWKTKATEGPTTSFPYSSYWHYLKAYWRYRDLTFWPISSVYHIYCYFICNKESDYLWLSSLSFIFFTSFVRVIFDSSLLRRS
mgnify:CR=1 FL=1